MCLSIFNDMYLRAVWQSPVILIIVNRRNFHMELKGNGISFLARTTGNHKFSVSLKSNPFKKSILYVG